MIKDYSNNEIKNLKYISQRYKINTDKPKKLEDKSIFSLCLNVGKKSDKYIGFLQKIGIFITDYNINFGFCPGIVEMFEENEGGNMLTSESTFNDNYLYVDISFSFKIYDLFFEAKCFKVVSFDDTNLSDVDLSFKLNGIKISQYEANGHGCEDDGHGCEDDEDFKKILLKYDSLYKKYKNEFFHDENDDDEIFDEYYSFIVDIITHVRYLFDFRG